MADIRNQTLSGDQIIDGNNYIDCTFDGARLIYEGGMPPGFQNTRFDNSQFRFQGPAGYTLAFLKAMSPAQTGMRHMVQGLLPELYE